MRTYMPEHEFQKLMSETDNDVRYQFECDFTDEPSLEFTRPCPGFKHCLGEEYDERRVDCLECKEDALNAVKAAEIGG